MKVAFKRVFFSALLCGSFSLQVEARAKYPVYPEREMQVLDGSWSFAWLGAADWTTLEPGCFSVCDLLSINYYPGWIGSVAWDRSSSAQIPGYIEKIAQWFDNPANKDVYDKPLITSETGCCGVYGLRDRALAQWSEDYQADYFVASIQASMGNPRFCGVVLWQLFDTRSYVNRGEVRGKYRGYNNAGLVDEYRRPKLAYDEVQKVFKELK